MSIINQFCSRLNDLLDSSVISGDYEIQGKKVSHKLKQMCNNDATNNLQLGEKMQPILKSWDPISLGSKIIHSTYCLLVKQFD